MCPPVLTPRVITLIHDPVLENHHNQKLHQFMGWNDPEQLIQQYIQDVATASHGLVRYTVVERHEIDGFPEKIDGFSYTDEAYLRCWQMRTSFHQPDGAAYLKLLDQVDFGAKVDSNLVDELWLLGFPYAGYFESTMGGRGAFWCNAPPIAGTQYLKRRFVVMGFNYERDVGCMLEDLGHRAESIMEYVYRNVPKDRNLWQQFCLYDKVARGRSACGNVHFAPNSERDYDWGNRRMVKCTADDWMHYPNLTGSTRNMNSAEWGNGDMRSHHIWWMQHFPRVEGTTQAGIANNWWRYVIDPNEV